MNGACLTTAAERAGQRYGILLGALSSVFSHYSSTLEPGSASARSGAAARAYELAESYLIDEAVHIQAAIEQEREDAAQQTRSRFDAVPEPASEEIVSHTDLIAAELENALRVQLERDIAALLRGLRDMALRASLLGRARGVTRQNALASMRAGNAIQPLQFTFLDRAGKRWSSERLVRTVWRHALVLVWNETALMVMAEHGVVEATIRHPDENYAENGTVISLGEEPTGIIWDQVRDHVFHPNSNAWLSPVIL